MPGIKPDHPFQISILETISEMVKVENLQRLVWPGNETDIVPAHLMLTSALNGGLVIGIYDATNGRVKSSFDIKDAPAGSSEQPGELVGFVFGFPGLYPSAGGLRLKHCSHMLGIHPDYRDHGLGFALKRAQWQMVRHQGIDLITWTYDPLLSRNANLNIASLGAVCDTYMREAYGEMRDGLNIGLPSDRFKVEWWVNSQRVKLRLSKKARRKLDLAHFLAAEVNILNPSMIGDGGLPHPAPLEGPFPEAFTLTDAMYLVEIPADFMTIKAKEAALALEWRLHFRQYSEILFQHGYLVTDFIYLPGTSPRSFYVFSNGKSTL